MRRTLGTLYRHFPTREALVEAVYRAELSRLCASAGELLAVRSPDGALRAWMDRFARPLGGGSVCHRVPSYVLLRHRSR